MDSNGEGSWYVFLGTEWRGPWDTKKVCLEILFGTVKADTPTKLLLEDDALPADSFPEIFGAENTGYDVFISHSAKDKSFADAIVHRLETDKLRCWVAPRDIHPGETWAGGIMDGIKRCKVFLLVVTEYSNTSRQVLSEVERAVHNGLIILPFKIDCVEVGSDLEFFISSHHWLESMNPPLERDLGRLSRAVQVHLQTELGIGEVEETEDKFEQGGRNRLWILGLAVVALLTAGFLGWRSLALDGNTQEVVRISQETTLEPQQASAANQPPSNGELKGEPAIDTSSLEAEAGAQRLADKEAFVRQQDLQAERDRRTDELITMALEKFGTASTLTLSPPGVVGNVHFNLGEFVQIGGSERQVVDISLASNPALVTRVAWLWQSPETTSETVVRLPFQLHSLGIAPAELRAISQFDGVRLLEIARDSGGLSFRWGAKSMAFLPEEHAFAIPVNLSVDANLLGHGWAGGNSVLALEQLGEISHVLTVLAKETAFPLGSWEMSLVEDNWWPWSLVPLQGNVSARKAGALAARITSDGILLAGASITEVFRSNRTNPRFLLQDINDLALLGTTWEARVQGGENEGKKFLITWRQVEAEKSEMAILLREIYATSGLADELNVSAARGKLLTDRRSELWHFEAQKAVNPVVRKSPWSLFDKKTLSLRVQFLSETTGIGVLGDGQTFTMELRQDEEAERLTEAERFASLRKIFASSKKYTGSFRAPNKGRLAINLMVRKRSSRSSEIEIKLYTNGWSSDYKGTYAFDSFESVHWPIRVMRTSGPKRSRKDTVVFGSKNAALYLRLGENGHIYGYSAGELYEFIP